MVEYQILKGNNSLSEYKDQRFGLSGKYPHRLLCSNTWSQGLHFREGNTLELTSG